ncbi:MAG: hypothetical protein JW804_00035 [Sedimentisphaerales bacterium]|nr:hypothetical protein [Sedimentisphaerales bacterium]
MWQPESWRTTSVTLGTAAYGSVKARINARQQVLTGQKHHAISKKVHNAIQDNPSLRGNYKYRDPRFMTKAKDIASHNGYETWHRQLDKEVVNWVEKNSKATTSQFESYLKNRYQKSDLINRFPKGLE